MKASFFKGLAASGWLTAAIVMRLRVESIKVFGGMIGAGVEEMRWTERRSVPATRIRTEIEVVSVRHSASRKDYGVVRTRTLAYNQEQQNRHALHRQLPSPPPQPEGLTFLFGCHSAAKRRNLLFGTSLQRERLMAATHPP